MKTLQSLHVHLLPSLIDPSNFVDRSVVVIDVLRATTTIIHALAAGAKEVIPCLDIEQAQQIAARQMTSGQGGSVLLGGERGGTKIAGFDLGNSPAEYVADKVVGQTIVFTTTNGTLAMNHARQARLVLLGAFVNLSAVCCELDGHIDLLCAGTRGKITRDDTLVAGAMVEKLTSGLEKIETNDQAQLALDAWRGVMPGNLAAELRRTRAGRDVMAKGRADDIDIAVQIDKFDIVPEIDLADWSIRAL